MAVVSITSVGDPRYGFSARQTVRSVLDHTGFDVVALCDRPSAALLPRSDRVMLEIVEPSLIHRADPFLLKFEAWRSALDRSADDLIVHLDADAVVRASITDDDLRSELGVGQFAMVEQTTIAGSTMGRAEFLDHYLGHSHRYLVPLLPEPDLERFRYFNSGLIVFRRLELRNFLDWADDLRRDLPAHHTIGAHMIADQDYLQVWANVIRAGARSEMGPEWNHCPLWDRDFPRDDGRIVHLSNFCNGPPVRTALALQAHRTEGLERPTGGPWTDLAFCLVTHDSADDLDECLAALDAFDGAELVVVDNGSSDATRAILNSRGIDAILNVRNEGFASAANRAARATDRPVLCFVNPDAFVDLEALDGVCERIVSDPLVALVPDYVHEDGRIVRGAQLGYTRTKVLLDILRTGRGDDALEWIERAIEVDNPAWVWPVGACLAIARETFERIGGFDERYFVYMEDVAIGAALHAIGGSVASTGSTVLHLGAHGSGIDRPTRDRMLDESRVGFASHAFGDGFGRLAASALLLRRTVDRWRR